MFVTCLLLCNSTKSWRKAGKQRMSEGVNLKIEKIWRLFHLKEMVVALKRCIFDPIMVKPKCVREAADFWKNYKQTAEKCKPIFENWKKTTASQTHFGFPNFVSNMHRFSSTAICFWQFPIGTPCSNKRFCLTHTLTKSHHNAICRCNFSRKAACLLYQSELLVSKWPSTFC